MPADKPRRLGRGLEALLATTGRGEERSTALESLPISRIRANPYQPRKEFSPEELDDLKASLKASGLLQPITVRRAGKGGAYELIAGERRLRAATALGWTEIQAIVREIDDQTLLTLALVENLQRSDLNPLEEAEGYQRLMSEFSLTQQQVADLVGKNRSTVANLLRILALPPSVRRLLADGQLSLGHARAILAASNEQAMAELAREAVARGLTVREVEARTRTRKPEQPRQRQREDRRPPEIRRLEDELRRRFQTDVQLTLGTNERGSVTIQFYSADDLERIVELMLPHPRS